FDQASGQFEVDLGFPYGYTPNNQLSIEVGNAYSAAQAVRTGVVFTPGKWVHLAGIFTPGEMYLYLNGKYINKLAYDGVTNSAVAHAGIVCIGDEYDNT